MKTHVPITKQPKPARRPKHPPVPFRETCPKCDRPTTVLSGVLGFRHLWVCRACGWGSEYPPYPHDCPRCGGWRLWFPARRLVLKQVKAPDLEGRKYGYFY
jgi:hypothetical protein